MLLSVPDKQQSYRRNRYFPSNVTQYIVSTDMKTYREKTVSGVSLYASMRFLAPRYVILFNFELKNNMITVFSAWWTLYLWEAKKQSLVVLLITRGSVTFLT